MVVGAKIGRGRISGTVGSWEKIIAGDISHTSELVE